MIRPKYGPGNPDETYKPHRYEEHLFDTGEVLINYATAGPSDKPAVILIPGQTESWWGYEKAMGLLSEQFQAFAVDLRGQGRSSRTPGRYTYDNFGNDIVRFIAFRIKRPVIVSGLSSGGVIAAWLSAYAPPGMIRGAHYEDPPLFSSETEPAFGPGIREGAGPVFELYSAYLGNQWRVGDWEGMLEGVSDFLPAHRMITFQAGYAKFKNEPPQNMKEYDPEWAKAFITGSVGASCDHERMLAKVKCPVLFTHHLSKIDPETGRHSGASTVQQVDQVEAIVKKTGQPFSRLSFPEMGHNMHLQDPELYARTFTEWTKTLPGEEKI
ncbi:MAG: alpha/beta hydrolase [Proteobacteria bacterium]|nr:alpha/beta hydrolase [Pseudomonadota bacterium]MBU4471680.1 alpha/beta hydrolase [Pseudomonadota bacterium]MCG2750657.1 alpha/beta hydrolase [Desulfobacteraceae bacterium]